MITTEELFLLKENNVSISKITYSYKFSQEIINEYNYKCNISNKTKNNLLSSIYDKLFFHNNNIVLDNSRNKINFVHYYNDKYYTINISHTTITFNSIDFEDIDGLNKEIFNLLQFKENDMIKNKYDNITYRIDYNSFNINSMIKSFNDQKLSQKEQFKNNGCIFIHKKKTIIKCYDDIKQNKIKLKIKLFGRNKWLISQNRNHGSVDDFVQFYKYIKNTIILPHLLRYLQTNQFSLFSYLLPEIIDIIINMLKTEKYFNNLLLDANLFLIPMNIDLFVKSNNLMKIAFR